MPTAAGSLPEYPLIPLSTRTATYVLADQLPVPVLSPKPLRHIVVHPQCCVQPLICHITQLAQMIKFAKAQQPGWKPCHSEGFAKHLYMRSSHQLHAI
jgi:hypothetical protein